ncbi:class I SAM-dependent methyltransferase [Tahibacter amnicola]|uniref:Methyltransferase domain-containing protein n=1 Tax=Tahibacter amnicola TaxID=2976241 RepID=A0ABY6BEY1_9GAMM|nr:class I SAM-dependent methyltransferase [Tahibacter amnicola]UXI67828.1 methyltransferase domain-containing protein [Tahibacter amnicola]
MNALNWDYSALATHYDKRAPYATDAIDALVAALQLDATCAVADIGAGTGRLSLPLAERGLTVTAVEPNPQMRAIGEQIRHPRLRFVDGCGETTGLPAGAFGLVSYGSSFNVLDTTAALDESCRLLQNNGAIALLFNHRDLEDPLQREVEAVIRHHVPDYAYGSRRDDPTPRIAQHGGFGTVQSLSTRFIHRTSRADFIDGFRAHATLLRQAGAARAAVFAGLEALLADQPVIDVPFTTRAWYAHRRPC